MKKILLSLIALAMLASCEQGVMDQDVNGDTVSISLNIPGTRNLAALTNPTVDYTIYKGTERYLVADNIPLTNTAGKYTVDINLAKSATYKFTEFTVKEGTSTVYILNPEVASNNAGFTVAADGTTNVAPTVHLAYQIGDGYTPESSGALTVVTDYTEGSAVDLTFKVSIPVGTTVEVDQKSSATSWGGHFIKLNDGDVYDMDTDSLYDPSRAGDGVPYEGFKFVIKTADNRIYTQYFTAADYNKKEVIFSAY